MIVSSNQFVCERRIYSVEHLFGEFTFHESEKARARSVKKSIRRKLSKNALVIYHCERVNRVTKTKRDN